jgi:hypothetical protein
VIVKSRSVLFIVSTALLARLVVFLFLTTDRLSMGDPAAYQAIAQSVLSGRGMAVDAYGITVRSFYPPLYPLLLAGTFAPTSQPAILALNFAIDLGTATAIIWLAQLIGQRRAGTIAAAIYLLWPSNVLFASIPQKEGLSTLLVVLTAALALKTKPVLLGLVTGLLALCQPALAPLPYLFMAALLPREAWVRTAGIAALSTVAVLAPWWIRNYLVFNAFVPLTTATGGSLWVGTFSADAWFLKPPTRLLMGGELAFSHAAATEAWRWICAHPLEYALHCLGKLGRAFVGGWWAVDRVARMNPPIPWFMVAVPFTIALSAALNALAIVGAITVAGPIRRLLLACLIQILLFQTWFEFSERHTYFLLPFLMLSAVVGLMMLRPKAGGSGMPA